MKYLVRFDYGYVSKIGKTFFEWSDEAVALSEEEKNEAVKNMKHYNFNYKVVEIKD